MEDMPIHTPPTCTHTVYKNTLGFRLCRTEGTSWCLSTPQMPASWEMVFSTDKTHTHKDKHAAHSERCRRDGCQCECSVPEPASWYHSFSLCLCLSVFLCHSDALRCIRSYIHHLQSLCSLSGVLSLPHTHMHTLKQTTLLSPLLSKNWGIWWLNDPMHPLSLSSRYHIHFMLSSSWALPERQPLRLTVSSLWLCYHISRDKYKGWGAWHF